MKLVEDHSWFFFLINLLENMSNKLSRSVVTQHSVDSTESYLYCNRTFDDLNNLFLHACTQGDYMLVDSLLCEGLIKADVTNRIGKRTFRNC